MSVFLALAAVALMLLIPAALAVRKHDGSADDYLTAKRGIHWLPAGVSAGVSMLSGFSFTALVGYAYEFGMFAIWFVIVRNIGEIAISWFVWPKLYDAAVKRDCVTLGQLAGSVFGKRMDAIRLFSGAVVAFLLTVYVSSQLQSAGIALEQTVNMPAIAGMTGAGAVLAAYCFWGGVRSSIWTDNSQAVMMLVTLLSVPAGILYSAGGFGGMAETLHASAGADYLNPFTHPDIPYKGLYVFSLLYIGFCILGQPHVFSRFITVKDKRAAKKAQLTYYVTALSMNLLAVLAGVMIRAVIDPATFTDASGDVNAEAALFAAAVALFPLWFVYVIAAGAASASMSTGDSQIQAAANALIFDIVRPLKRIFSGAAEDDTRPRDWTDSHWASKCVTAGMIALATAGAAGLSGHTVFDIVEVAWSTQGAVFFVPFILYACTKGRFIPAERVLLAVMLCCAAVTLSWKFAGLNHIAYPAMPGMSAAALLLWLYSISLRDGSLASRRKPR